MTMQEIKQELETKATQYNAAALAEQYAKMSKLDKEMQDLVSDYAKKSKEAYLDEKAKSKTPLTDSIIAPQYKVLKIKDTTDNDSGIITRSVDETNKTIQLNDLSAKFNSSFRFKNWKAYIEQLNLRLCLYTANKLELPTSDRKEIEEKFRMVNGGRDIDLGATPTSNTQLLKQLRTVCNGIMGESDIEGKITSHDVEYLKMVYTTKGRELRNIRTLNSAKLADAIINIMNRVMTDASYSITYQKSTDNAAGNTVTEAKQESKATAKETPKAAEKATAKETPNGKRGGGKEKATAKETTAA